MKVKRPRRVAALSTTVNKSKVMGRALLGGETDFFASPSRVTEELSLTFQWGMTRKTAVMIIPGRQNQREPFKPKWIKNKVAMMGPMANPKFPPKWNREMTVAFLSALNKFTVLNPSGWKLACPMPLRDAKNKIQV